MSNKKDLPSLSEVEAALIKDIIALTQGQIASWLPREPLIRTITLLLTGQASKITVQDLATLSMSQMVTTENTSQGPAKYATWRAAMNDQFRRNKRSGLDLEPKPISGKSYNIVDWLTEFRDWLDEIGINKMPDLMLYDGSAHNAINNYGKHRIPGHLRLPRAAP